MKRLGYEHQGASTYLVYELGPEDTVDSMSLGMLMNNRIPGLVSVIFTQFDNIKQVKYDVTALVPADQYLLGTVNKKRLLGVFRGIAQAFLSAEDYMIAPETIQLDQSCIFSDVVTGETTLICVPVIAETGGEKRDLKNFLKEILFSSQYDARENQDYVARIMSYLSGTPSFSAREFRDLLDYAAREPVVQREPQQVQVPAAEQWDAAPVSPPEVKPARQTEASAQPASPPADSTAATQSQPISLFYLLQHYNKENAAAYKAQKEQKKLEKGAGDSKKKERKKEAAPPSGFAVPGQKEQPIQAEIPLSPAPQAYHAPPARPAHPVQPVQPARPTRQPEPVYQPFQPAPPQQPDQAIVRQPLQQPVGVGAGVFDEQSTVYFPREDQDETVLLGQEIPVRHLTPYLLRKKNQEKILITKQVFRIGRDQDYNDYVIAENRYVGHSHCHILSREGEFFLIDDNSKNRSRINGQVITAGVEAKLAHGCLIKIADEEFEFRLY